MRRSIFGLFLALGLPIGATVVTGCIHHDAEVVILSDGGSRTMLAAAHANQLMLFGDLPQSESVPTYARVAVSLIQHTFAEVGSDFDPDIDPTDTRIIFSSTRHSLLPDLYIKNVDGVAVTQLTSDPASDIQPAFSPDGKRIAFASNRSGNWDIWIVSIDGGPAVQITQGRSDELHPNWSPDGRQLVFSRLPVNGGPWELWIADAGSGATRRFIGHGLFPDWSPTNNTILFQRARQRGNRWFSIWTMTMVDGEPRYPTEVASSDSNAVILPAWGPDGRRIAFSSTTTTATFRPASLSPVPGEAFDIWIMDADGRHKSRLTDGSSANFAPTFSPSGRVFFISNRSGNENIWSLNPRTLSLDDHSGSSVTAADLAKTPTPIRVRAAATQGGL